MRTAIKWIIAAATAAIMIVGLLWNLDDYEAVDKLHEQGAAPAEDFGPSPVVPRSTKGDGDIDVWKPVKE